MKSFFLSSILLFCFLNLISLAQETPLARQPATEKTVPITLEISRPDSSINYRSTVSLRAKFYNQSDKSQVLCLDNQLDFFQTDRSIRCDPSVFLYHDAKRTGFVVQPHESLEIILPSRLFFLGKHKIVAEYEDRQNNIPLLKSNAFEIEIKDHQSNPYELRKINNRNNALINEILLSPAYQNQNKQRDASYQKYVQDELLIYSPYCILPLQAALQDKAYQPVAIDIVEILGMIADKDKAASRGYIRDTSSADLVIERIGKEPDAGVKIALLKIVGKFFDVLTPPQRETLEKTVLAQLAQADAGVRVQAALTLLELFPAQRAAIETALAKPDFADAAGRKTIAEVMAKAKVSNP
jgi:hypothetical protein